MIKPQFKVEGLSELQAKLRQIPRNQGGPALKRGLNAAAKVLSDTAAARAPRRTGRLQGAMTWSAPRRRGDVTRLRVGPDRHAWYGLYQEIGTSHHPAQPFLRPAVDEKGRESVLKMRDQLRRELKKLETR